MSDHEITSGAFAGQRLRMRADEPELQEAPGGRWKAAPLRKLATAYPVGEGPWPWLLERGVRRPQPSGTSGATQRNSSRAESGRVRLPTVWLTEEESEALENRRKGRSVRDTIGALLLAK